MNLVFFVDALSHAVRISRILRQPRGEAVTVLLSSTLLCCVVRHDIIYFEILHHFKSDFSHSVSPSIYFQGNAMLIGVGGSGKQSLTKMASFVGGMACLSIEINRGYGIKEFREDIKKFMLKTGVEGLDTVFLFTDSQVPFHCITAIILFDKRALRSFPFPFELYSYLFIPANLIFLVLFFVS